MAKVFIDTINVKGFASGIKDFMCLREKSLAKLLIDTCNRIEQLQAENEKLKNIINMSGGSPPPGNLQFTDILLPLQTNLSELKKRVINTLEWMVKDMTWRADETKLNFEEHEKGDYSPELTEAINLLAELKKGE